MVPIVKREDVFSKYDLDILKLVIPLVAIILALLIYWIFWGKARRIAHYRRKYGLDRTQLEPRLAHPIETYHPVPPGTMAHEEAALSTSGNTHVGTILTTSPSLYMPPTVPPNAVVRLTGTAN